ncbi:hypothetical protein [Streptomyces sp. NPDC002779]|uniref:hypothetical protein n=1 Tax=Streptomyces sp. NPDC002779 TaxID=3364664 RepID=UPI00369F3CB0
MGQTKIVAVTAAADRTEVTQRRILLMGVPALVAEGIAFRHKGGRHGGSRQWAESISATGPRNVLLNLS